MRRLTEIPSRQDFEGEERRAYDLLAGKWRWGAYPPPAPAGGELKPDPLTAVSPLIGWAWNAKRFAIGQRQGLPGTYQAYHHEIATLTIAFDLGFNDFVPIHLRLAVTVGLRPEAVVAIREKDDAALEDGERVAVRFVRQVLDGTVTDESFAAMRDQLGTERGVFDFVQLVLAGLVSVRTTQAFGGGGRVTDEQVDKAVQALLDGSLPGGDLEAYENMFGKHPDRAIRICTDDD